MPGHFDVRARPITEPTRRQAAGIRLGLGRALAAAGGRNAEAGMGLERLGGELAHRRLAGEQVLDLLARQRLVFEQAARDCVQVVEML